MKPLVYVAGPLSGPEHDENIKRALGYGELVWAMGAIPYVPHLSAYWEQEYHHPYEDWLDMDLNTLLPKMEALFRMPGDSPGADREVSRARLLGLPVFTDLQALGLWVQEWKRVWASIPKENIRTL